MKKKSVLEVSTTSRTLVYIHIQYVQTVINTSINFTEHKVTWFKHFFYLCQLGNQNLYYDGMISRFVDAPIVLCAKIFTFIDPYSFVCMHIELYTHKREEHIIYMWREIFMRTVQLKHVKS